MNYVWTEKKENFLLKFKLEVATDHKGIVKTILETELDHLDFYYDITYSKLRKMKRFGIWETRTTKSDKIHLALNRLCVRDFVVQKMIRREERYLYFTYFGVEYDLNKEGLHLLNTYTNSSNIQILFIADYIRDSPSRALEFRFNAKLKRSRIIL